MKESVKYKILKAATKVVPDGLFHISANYYLHLRNGVFPRYLNVKKPKKFNEKIIFNKLYNRFENGHLLADKYEVRQFIKETIGEEYLIPLIGLFDNADSIPFTQLPSQFVIKITQGSGWNIIVRDKASADTNEIKKRLGFWLNLNYSVYGREWQYNPITNKIILEEFLDNSIYPLHDYKFFCFNGQPQYVQVDADRSSNHTRNFYNLDWELQPFKLLYPNSNLEIKRPAKLEEMVSIARIISKKLSHNMNFVRIDLYNHYDKIYFGEITFHPDGGCAPFTPKKYDNVLGEKIK